MPKRVKPAAYYPDRTGVIGTAADVASGFVRGATAGTVSTLPEIGYLAQNTVNVALPKRAEVDIPMLSDIAGKAIGDIVTPPRAATGEKIAPTPYVPDMTKSTGQRLDEDRAGTAAAIEGAANAVPFLRPSQQAIDDQLSGKPFTLRGGIRAGAESAGLMAPLIALAAVNPVASNVLMWNMYGAPEANTLIAEGRKQKAAAGELGLGAVAQFLLQGGVEAGSTIIERKLFGGKLPPAAKRTVGKWLAEVARRTVRGMPKAAAVEYLEEVIQGEGGELVRRALGMDAAEFGQRSMEALIPTVTSMVLFGPLMAAGTVSADTKRANLIENAKNLNAPVELQEKLVGADTEDKWEAAVWDLKGWWDTETVSVAAQRSGLFRPQLSNDDKGRMIGAVTERAQAVARGETPVEPEDAATAEFVRMVEGGVDAGTAFDRIESTLREAQAGEAIPRLTDMRSAEWDRPDGSGSFSLGQIIAQPARTPQEAMDPATVDAKIAAIVGAGTTEVIRPKSVESPVRAEAAAPLPGQVGDVVDAGTVAAGLRNALIQPEAEVQDAIQKRGAEASVVGEGPGRGAAVDREVREQAVEEEGKRDAETEAGVGKPPELMTLDEWVPEHNAKAQRFIRMREEYEADVEMFGQNSPEAKTSRDRMDDAENAMGKSTADGAHQKFLTRAIAAQRPVSAAAVDAYGIKLPPGYTRQGDRFTPPKASTAPAPTAKKKRPTATPKRKAATKQAAAVAPPPATPPPPVAPQPLPPPKAVAPKSAKRNDLEARPLAPRAGDVATTRSRDEAQSNVRAVDSVSGVPRVGGDAEAQPLSDATRTIRERDAASERFIQENGEITFSVDIPEGKIGVTRQVIVSKSPSTKMWRITWIDSDGDPLGHSDYGRYSELLESIQRDWRVSLSEVRKPSLPVPAAPAPSTQVETPPTPVEATPVPEPAPAKPTAMPKRIKPDSEDSTADIIAEAERKHGSPLRTKNGKWRTGLVVAFTDQGKPYKKPPHATILRVIDSENAQVKFSRPGQQSAVEIIPISRLSESSGAIRSREREAFLAELTQEQKAQVKADSKAFDDLLYAGPPFTDNEDINQIENAGFERDKAIAKSRHMRSVRDIAAKELGAGNIDMNDPRERARLLPALREYLKKAEVTIDYIRSLKNSYDNTSLSPEFFDEDDLIYKNGEWHLVSKLKNGTTVLQDGTIIELEAGEEINISGIVRPDYPGYKEAMAEYRIQEEKNKAVRADERSTTEKEAAEYAEFEDAETERLRKEPAPAPRPTTMPQRKIEVAPSGQVQLLSQAEGGFKLVADTVRGGKAAKVETPSMFTAAEERGRTLDDLDAKDAKALRVQAAREGVSLEGVAANPVSMRDAIRAARKAKAGEKKTPTTMPKRQAESAQPESATAPARTVTPELAKRLLSLPYEYRTYPAGDRNAELRRDVIEAVTGTRPPKAKAGATAVRDALAAHFKAPNDSINRVEKHIIAELEKIAGVEKPTQDISDETTAPAPASEGPLFSDTYTGPRFTYGLRYRPMQIGAQPKGYIIQSDGPATDRFRYGTIQYPRQLTADELKAYEMEEIAPTPTTKPRRMDGTTPAKTTAKPAVDATAAPATLDYQMQARATDEKIWMHSIEREARQYPVLTTRTRYRAEAKSDMRKAMDAKYPLTAQAQRTQPPATDEHAAGDVAYEISQTTRGRNEEIQKLPESADPKDIEDVRRMREQIAKETGTEFRAVPLDRRDVYPAANAELDALSAMEDVFAKRVVFYRTPAGQDFSPNGITSPAVKDVIFINAESDGILLKTMGHELVHHMRFDNYPLYAELMNNFADIANDFIGYRREYVVRAGGRVDSPKIHADELLADIAGNAVLDKRFWDTLAVKNPSLFQRASQYVSKWIESARQKILDFIGGRLDVVRRFTKDADAARNMVADAMAKYATTRQTGRAAGDVAREATPESRTPTPALDTPSTPMLQGASNERSTDSPQLRDTRDVRTLDAWRQRVHAGKQGMDARGDVSRKFKARFDAIEVDPDFAATEAFRVEERKLNALGLVVVPVKNAPFSARYLDREVWIDSKVADAESADNPFPIERSGKHEVLHYAKRNPRSAHIVLTLMDEIDVDSTTFRQFEQNMEDRYIVAYGEFNLTREQLKEEFAAEWYSGKGWFWLNRERVGYEGAFRDIGMARELAEMVEAGLTAMAMERDDTASMSTPERGRGAAGVTPEQDAAYMAAVEAGDKETAQRMVDEAAKAAGYELRVFHGTSEARNDLQGGTFVTNDLKAARAYAYMKAIERAIEDNDEFSSIVSDIMAEEGAENIQDLSVRTLEDIADANGIEVDFSSAGETMRLYLKASSVLDMTDAGTDVGTVSETWDELHAAGVTDDAWGALDEEARFEIEDEYAGKALYTMLERENVFSKAFEKGYDAVSFRDISPDLEAHTTWVSKEAAQLKLADPVTYDDSGNVIPLSERFNAGSEDIRFDTPETTPPPPLDETAKWDAFIRAIDQEATKRKLPYILSRDEKMKKLFPQRKRDTAAPAPTPAPARTPPSPSAPAQPVTAKTDPWEFVTGTRNLISDAEYERQGLPAPERSEQRKWEDVVIPEARRIWDKDRGYAARLVKELLNAPRAVTDTETALLTHEAVRLKGEVLRARQAKDAARESDAQDAYNEAMSAFALIGTKLGQALAARKILLQQDYSYANQAMLLERAKQRTLTDKEKSKLGQDTARIAEIQKRLDEIAAQLADVRASEAQKTAEIRQFKDIFNRAIANDTSTAGADMRKTRAQEARTRIEARRQPAAGFDARAQMFDTPDSTAAGMDPDLLADYAAVGATLFDEGVRDEAAWKARMTADFGPGIESRLDLIRAEAHRIFVETENQAAAKAEPSVRKRQKRKKAKRSEKPAGDDEAALRKFIRARVAFHVTEGMTDHEAIMQEVTEDVRDLGAPFDSLDRVDVGQKFSGYGEGRPLDQTPPKPKVRELRRLEQLVQGLRTVEEEGKAPLPSGSRRDRQTAEVRAVTRKLRVAIRDAGITLTSEGDRLATAMETAERTLSNHIEDMQRAISEGKEIERTKGTRLTSPELEALRARRDALQIQYEEKFNIELKKFKRHLDKQIENVNAAIEQGERTGDYTRPPRKPTLEERGKLDAEATAKALELAKLRRKLENARMPPFDRIMHNLRETGRFIRSMKSGADGSYIRRQAKIMFNHDIGSLDMILTGRRRSAFLPAAKSGILGFFSEQYFNDAMQEDVNNHAKAVTFAKKYGLYTALDKDTPISRRVESGLSAAIERVPWGIGWAYRAGNRSTTLVGNKGVIALYEQMAPGYQAAGELSTQADERRLAKLIGDMIGRAVMPRAVGARHVLQFASDFMFSSRFALSRGRSVATVYGLISKSSAQRKEGFRTLFGTVMSTAGTLAVLAAINAAMGDDDDDYAEVNFNPLSPDFMKIKIGNTRIDILSGEGQVVRFFARLATGKTVDWKTGKIQDISRKRVIDLFLAGKQAPIISAGKAILFQEGYSGRKLKTAQDWIDALAPYPLWIQDGLEVFLDQYGKNQDAWQALMPGVAASTAAWFGESFQTYGEDSKQKTTSFMPSRRRQPLQRQQRPQRTVMPQRRR